MLDFDLIKSQYPQELQGFERPLLREYLQYKILQGIFDSGLADKLSFIGGTALRIIHGNTRFSEDIDLENFGLDHAGFQTLIETLRRFLELEGFEVEIRNAARGAFRCYIRFPDLLFDLGISPLREEKILIQIDPLAQGYPYQPEIKILNKFDVFTQIRVTPVDLLLSQKIYTAVNRKRPRGRDFYDISFLLGIARPEMGFLREKMGVETAEDLRWTIVKRIDGLDFTELARDVAPFLLHASQVKRVEAFRATWEQANLQRENLSNGDVDSNLL
ncbi:MAG TPA: nucleotidyl transferase AbiEii/AbiGii toxin family protein [Anaerolineales bacterium]|nr:nucleotidyl transferase AbiEii/AbiGii toxin family protein [Anaerolineales bacterium]